MRAHKLRSEQLYAPKPLSHLEMSLCAPLYALRKRNLQFPFKSFAYLRILLFHRAKRCLNGSELSNLRPRLNMSSRACAVTRSFPLWAAVEWELSMRPDTKS